MSDYCKKMRTLFLFFLLGMLSFSLSAQQNSHSTKTVTATGTVVDVNNEPLPGVTVMVVGTKIIVATDIDGGFKLSFPEKEKTMLQFELLGMKTQQVPYKAGKKLNIVMEEDAIMLDNVVVTGYSSIRKESFTGTSTTVGKNEILSIAPTNVMKALSAFDPSIKMVTNNAMGSDPNNMSEYYVRGRSGVSEVKELDVALSEDVSEFALKNNPSAPIFILDGFEVDQATIYDLDVNRIQSVTILKDAAATAVYGSRAANGIIVVETITPPEGKIYLSYTNTTSMSTPDLTSYDLMNAQEALEAEWYAGLFESTSNDKNAGGLINYDELYNNVRRGVNTDWLAKPVRTAVSHKHSLNLGGGSDSFKWSADLNYQNKAGVMKGSSRQNYGGAMTLDYRYKTLQIKNKVTFNAMDSKESPYGSFSEYARMKPYLDPINPETGQWYKTFLIYRNIRSSVSEPVYVENPLYEATLGSFTKQSYKEFLENFSLNWNITPHLLAKATMSMSYKIQDNNSYIDPMSGKYVDYAITERGSLRENDLKSTRWTLNGLVSYNRDIKNNHINVTWGIEASENISSSKSTTYIGFVEGAKPSPNNALRLKDEPTYTDANSRRFGTYLQANYSYKDIYLFDIAGRYEGSSAFGAKKKMGLFYSGGIGLNLHNYEFLKDSKWLDRFKIKATYGVTGKANFSPYMARTTYEIQYDNPYIDQWGMILKALGNEDLMWEKVKKFDVGAELAFLKNAITVQFDYYRDMTTDQVEDVSLPSSSGFATYKDNVGKVLNKGFDVKLNVRAFSNRDWDVYVFANINHNTNTIEEIGEALQNYNDRIDDFFAGSTNSTDSKYSQPFTKYEVGNSLSAIYGMKSLGIDPATGKELYVKRDGTVTYTWSSAEQQCLGDYDPDFSGTAGFNVKWKNWTLYSTLNFKYGGQAYNNTLVSIENINLEKYSGDRRTLTDRWINVGDNAPLKSIKDRSYTTKPTSRFVQDDNELRLGSVSLGYTFNRTQLRKIGISALRLQLSTEEIFTLSSIRQERGTTYPFARTYNFSLNITL
ncbi:MAG: SusC/RagA family TonB-linked outer membrane protein [Bacteroidales bacterium]|nr:SusC/RagA family TonB-linked outer membrane protein [Bacteroidales bacterium]